VTIVTASLAGEPRGLVLNAFASVSLEPPLILVAVNRATATHEFLFRSDALAINILAGDQQDLAERFSRPIPNKFEGVPWHPGGNRAPLLDGVAASLEAKVQERISARTHTVFVGQVIAAEVHSRPPLVYLGGRFHDGIQLDSGDRQA
jgi:flavin reductase (DIM6/NTAB) family NADH-FMN oxidoreductase RutF